MLAECRGYFDPSLKAAATMEFPWLDQRSADPVYYGGQWYPSAENACPASRVADASMTKMLSRMEPASAAYAGAVSRAAAPDDGRDAIRAMYRIMASKFSEPDMRQKLLSTGRRPIRIRNARHDNLWGECACKRCRGLGQNRLGTILEILRADLSAQEYRCREQAAFGP